MPKQTWAPKPPIEKLSLAVRKNLRDEWESVRADYEKRVSDAADSGWSKDTPGQMFVGYAQGLAEAVENFVKEYGDDGKLHFNEAVTKSEFILHVDERGPDGATISCDVKDGTYRILFKEDCLGYNQNSVYETMLSAIDSVPREGFPLEIKHSISRNWDEEADEVRSAIAEITGIRDVVIDPNWEENYQKLSKGQPSSRDWKSSFGKVPLEYFRDGLKSQLESQGFKGDDLLQEGIAEGLPSKTFMVRIVEKLSKSGVIETVVEDGVCYIQTTVENWYYNVSSAGEGLVNEPSA